MLILGRSPNLVLGAVTAVFNVVVVFHVLGFNPDVTQIATANLMFASVIALIANSGSINEAAGNASRTRRINGNLPAERKTDKEG